MTSTLTPTPTVTPSITPTQSNIYCFQSPRTEPYINSFTDCKNYVINAITASNIASRGATDIAKIVKFVVSRLYLVGNIFNNYSWGDYGTTSAAYNVIFTNFGPEGSNQKYYFEIQPSYVTPTQYVAYCSYLYFNMNTNSMLVDVCNLVVINYSNNPATPTPTVTLPIQLLLQLPLR